MISQWNVAKVYTMHGMFKESKFNQPLNSWNTENLKYLSSMFEGASFNQPLDSWHLGQAHYLGYMFKGSQFNQDISNWDVTYVRGMCGFLSGNTFFSVENYDRLLQESSQLGLRNEVTLDIPQFYTEAGESGRQKLVEYFLWKIVDKGK